MAHAGIALSASPVVFLGRLLFCSCKFLGAFSWCIASLEASSHSRAFSKNTTSPDPGERPGLGITHWIIDGRRMAGRWSYKHTG